MVGQPTLRSADTDGIGPVKRRRRPALSCVECRMKKIRCDREKPCGACTRIMSPTCTYRPQRAEIWSQSERSPEATSASASRSNEHGHESSGGLSSQSTAPSNEFDLMINRYVAPGLFGEGAKLKPLPADRPSLALSSPSHAGTATVISSLLERISNLEGKQASTTAGEHAGTTAVPTPPDTDASVGQFVKAKFYGQSHWMNAIEPYDALGDANTIVNERTNRKEVNKSTELYSVVAEIKRMARIIKTSRMLQPSVSPELQKSIPPKAVCDSLVDCYLRTFEGPFRVLHIPSFRKEYEDYWSSTVPAKPSVILKMLLVCAIGVPFYAGSDRARLRAACTRWIQAAVEWLSAPHAKSRLNMVGLQIQILVLLARQVCNVDGDHIWIPAGTLLRTAMHLGLHRDPAAFSKISTYHGEMRRRLWATVLEITAQSSLDMGMCPMISPNDYDTKPPANVDDEDIGEGSDTPLDGKPLTVFTDSSIQIAFTQTLPIRLEIIRLINNLRFDLAYSDVLRLGTQLTNICREKTTFFKSALADKHNITPFKIKMSDSMVRRFVLCLHRPYFVKANENPQYHYSRKICLDTSLAMCAPATELLPGEEDDWTRMTHRCVGFFKSFFLYAISTVYFELNSQINEQREDSTLFAPLISTSAPSSTKPLTLPARFQALREVLEAARETAMARIRNGETNAKGVVFCNCVLARIDAVVSRADPDRAVLEAAKEAVREARQILTEVYREEHGEDIDLNLGSGPFAGKGHGRGDGADDVTGKNLPTGTAVNSEHDGVLPTFGASTDGLDMPDYGLGDMNMDIDLDLSAYMQGQTMDTGNGHHFARSPEWFHDLNGWAGLGNYNAGYNGFSM
ncbi:Nn.00g025770.m01.CDS01 [Neocucurbitaria sp. VM-36]